MVYITAIFHWYTDVHVYDWLTVDEEVEEKRDCLSTASSDRPPSVACNDVGVSSPEKSFFTRSGVMRSFRRSVNTRRAIGGVVCEFIDTI